MSDAREIVQPRWKRRATEIAEAIGGNSGGVSSVSLDPNTIDLLSQAIADAIDLKVLDINIKQYDDGLVSSSGLPIRTGTGPVSGGFLPLRVVTDVGDKLDINVKEYNDVSVDTRGLPVQAGRTTTNNTLVPLVVNCPTVNNFPTGGTGGTSLTSSQVEAAMSNAITTTLKNPNFPLGVDITRIRGTNVATSVNGVGAHFPIATYTSPLSVTGGSTLTGTVDVNIKEYDGTAVDTTGLPFKQGWAAGTNSREIILVAEQNTVNVNLAPALGSNALTAIPVTISGTVATTETAPVTTVSVDNHPTSTTVTGTVSVTETNPVSGGGGGGGGLNITDTTTAFKNALYGVGATTNITVHEQVETAMDSALANATGISVTESAPVTAVKITGDETYGIIMSKTYYVSGNTVDYDYQSIGYGLGVSSANTAKQGIYSSVWTQGWIIRVNGVDIQNQDISHGLWGASPIQNNHPGNLTLAQAYPWYIPADSQSTIDKYHGRKVTLSSVANVWIVEPLLDTVVVQADKDQFGYIGASYVPAGYQNMGGWQIMQDGVLLLNQYVYNDGLWRNSAHHASMIGAKVIRNNGFAPNGWSVVQTDTI